MAGLFISASGVANALQRNDIRANNVANVSTKGYRAMRPESAPNATGGVRVVCVTRDDRPGPPEASNVDLANEAAHRIVDSRTAEANIRAFRAQNNAYGDLINLIA